MIHLHLTFVKHVKLEQDESNMNRAIVVLAQACTLAGNNMKQAKASV